MSANKQLELFQSSKKPNKSAHAKPEPESLIKGANGQLAKCRAKIDDIDRTLLGLLGERLEVADMIAKIKIEAGLAIVDRSREEQVVQHIRALSSELGINPEHAERLIRTIIEISVEHQKRILPRVAYLGPAGTFSEQAAYKLFGNGRINELPLGSIKEVFNAAETDCAQYGIVPIENSSEGPVWKTYDRLLKTDLQVIGEVELEIHHCLLAPCDMERKEIKKIISHPQALGQCGKYLEDEFPHAKLMEAESTADAARIASENGYGAIASMNAASKYGLKVLAEKIEDMKENFTRFWAIGRTQMEAREGAAHKTSLILSITDEPGSLYRMLAAFEKKGINLSKIESRPNRKSETAWKYLFYIDISGNAREQTIAEAINEVSQSCEMLKVLGSYQKSNGKS